MTVHTMSPKARDPIGAPAAYVSGASACDALTGLLNRDGFERELQRRVAGGHRVVESGAVLIVDLDHFHSVNDRHGTDTGDQLIARVGQALRERMRVGDVVSRLEGDRFAVLVADADLASARSLATDLLAEIGGQAINGSVNPPAHVTASIGIASLDADPVPSVDTVLGNAILALSDAKAGGRNQVSYRCRAGSEAGSGAAFDWASEISETLASDRLSLVAQPIVPLQVPSPVRYELLLRIRDRSGKLIAPGALLSAAERLGLVCEIDRWVASRAIDMLAEHHQLGLELKLAVNLSGRSLGDPTLLEMIESGLRDRPIEPDSLIFEVTETAAVANMVEAAAFTNRLAGLGCRFALDDFGAGFGSFYYLKHLPFDFIKIDGEFVRHCVHNHTDRMLIMAMVQIARAMGKCTIAECIEDADTEQVLTGLGLDYGQGYHLGRPAALEQYLWPPGHHPVGNGTASIVYDP